MSISSFSQTRAVRKAIRNKEQVEKREDREYEKSRQDAISRHYKNQSEGTKRQMKISKKKAKEFDKKNESGLIEGLFKRHKTKKEERKRKSRTKRHY